MEGSFSGGSGSRSVIRISGQISGEFFLLKFEVLNHLHFLANRDVSISQVVDEITLSSHSFRNAHSLQLDLDSHLRCMKRILMTKARKNSSAYMKLELKQTYHGLEEFYFPPSLPKVLKELRGHGKLQWLPKSTRDGHGGKEGSHKEKVRNQQVRADEVNTKAGPWIIGVTPIQ